MYLSASWITVAPPYTADLVVDNKFTFMVGMYSTSHNVTSAVFLLLFLTDNDTLSMPSDTITAPCDTGGQEHG